MTESKPLSQIAQDAFALCTQKMQEDYNRAVQLLSEHALADAGLLTSDGWKVQQQPDGRFKFERPVADTTTTEAPPA